MSAELDELLVEAMTELGPLPGWPPPSPTGDEGEWRAEVARRRAEHDALALAVDARFGVGGKPARVGQISYCDIPTEGAKMGAAVYSPAPAADAGSRPAVVYLHGGAWWMGGGAAGLAINDSFCRSVCAGVGAVVVNVDYRLAPEHRFPAQTVDACAALTWVHEHAEELGVDRQRVALAGTSSGGNVAAVSAAEWAARGGTPLAAQLLIVPALDLTIDDQVVDPDPAMRAAIDAVRQYYFGDDREVADPGKSPVRAVSFAGLPPTVLVTGTLDPLRAGALTYLALLRDADVPVTHLEYEMTHGVATPATRVAMVADMVGALGAILR